MFMYLNVKERSWWRLCKNFLYKQTKHQFIIGVFLWDHKLVCRGCLCRNLSHYWRSNPHAPVSTVMVFTNWIGKPSPVGSVVHWWRWNLISWFLSLLSTKTDAAKVGGVLWRPELVKVLFVCVSARHSANAQSLWLIIYSRDLKTLQG